MQDYDLRIGLESAAFAVISDISFILSKLASLKETSLDEEVRLHLETTIQYMDNFFLKKEGDDDVSKQLGY